MSMAKAIAIKDDTARNLRVLAAALVTAIVTLDLVSLLIGGVVRPLLER